MIKEIIQFAGPYRLKSLKSMITSDGLAWTATLYRDGKKIGYIEDAGRGGQIQVNAPYNEVVALKTFAAEKTKQTFEPEHTFLAALADYTESITKMKRRNMRKPVQIHEKILDENGVPNSFSQFGCPNTPVNLEGIRRGYPTARLLQDEIHLW